MTLEWAIVTGDLGKRVIFHGKTTGSNTWAIQLIMGPVVVSVLRFVKLKHFESMRNFKNAVAINTGRTSEYQKWSLTNTTCRSANRK